MQNILVTGSAGFIGFHLSKYLLDCGGNVIGVDNLNDYYDVNLKKSRLGILSEYRNFKFYKKDICCFTDMRKIFRSNHINNVCHMAAQAGVRYSIEKPFIYQKCNNEGFLNIIECVRKYRVDHFVFASSSSVYGHNKVPFSEKDNTDNAISLYAATKKSNEITAHAYSHMYGINCSGLRFFSVYGPFGRPDMALFLFTKSIIDNEPIHVFNNGKMHRNFTYVDDIVDGICRVLLSPSPYEIYNIGNNKSEGLMDFIHEIEKNLGKKAIIKYEPMQVGDVAENKANINKISLLGYKPKTNIKEGIKKFIIWYKDYYGGK